MKKNFFISGMHCQSCEILLEETIKTLPGVIKAKASYRQNSLEIDSQKEIPEQIIAQSVEKLGYTLGNNHQNQIKNKTPEDYLHLVNSLAVIAILFYLYLKIDWFKFMPDISQSVSIVNASLIGVVASLSTCLALVGGIVISFSTVYQTNQQSQTISSKILPHIYFHLGRIISFMFLGGILGLIGSNFTYSSLTSAYLNIIIGIIMFYLGLRIIGLMPNLLSFNFSFSKIVYQKINQMPKNHHFWVPAIIGAFTFFLPCGFTQSMQLTAIFSGNFITGAMIMGAFAIGTFPVLIAIGIGTTYFQKSNFAYLSKIIGIIIIFLSIISIHNGLILSGHNLKWPSFNQQNKQSIALPAIVEKNDTQIITMNVDYTFKPNKFTLKKGVPVRWEIYGIKLTGCNNEVIIPKLGISSGKLKPGLNIVEFTPTESGVLPFSCWMGMITGEFIVE